MGGVQPPFNVSLVFLTLPRDEQGRPGRSVLIYVHTGTKLVWPPSLGLQIPQGLWVQLAIPEEGKRVVVYLKPMLMLGMGGCIHGGKGILLQDSPSYFKADIRVLVKAPSACPPDPQIWPLGKI